MSRPALCAVNILRAILIPQSTQRARGVPQKVNRCNPFAKQMRLACRQLTRGHVTRDIESLLPNILKAQPRSHTSFGVRFMIALSKIIMETTAFLLSGSL